MKLRLAYNDVVYVSVDIMDLLRPIRGRLTINKGTYIRQWAKKYLHVSVVSVGNKKLAFVKRKDSPPSKPPRKLP